VQPPRTPRNEVERQAALDRTGLLQAGTNLDLQDIVELAATICQTPMALVSLVDGRRQFLKSRVGLDVLETPRDISFCGHAILGTEPFVVSDAAIDERFADNPLVVGPPHIRFYAGIPLVVDDELALGTLCILDTQPRVLDEPMRDSLLRLARIARLCMQQLADRGRKPK
jgi:GAF domain-containing protein